MHCQIRVTHLFNGQEIIISSIIMTLQSNPPISQFNRLCNEFTSVWSMLQCNTAMLKLKQ